ncbi:hypothetical protein BB561_002004 [Smittium simulii]|uniref:CCHC-type domain-containing protein n=1 Tax=Smittium simulii TaxID=133385 RepID=A0A2T9YS63_9FUNG|nr:hypothetical protein BB561_002004 [Smittium simulii]
MADQPKNTPLTFAGVIKKSNTTTKVSVKHKVTDSHDPEPMVIPSIHGGECNLAISLKNYQNKIDKAIGCIAEKVNKETSSYSYDKIKKILYIHFDKVEEVIEFKKEKIIFEGQELRMSNTVEFGKNTIKINIPTYIGRFYNAMIESVKEQIVPKGKIIDMIIGVNKNGLKSVHDVVILMELDQEKTLPTFLEIRGAKYSLIYQGAPKSCNYCKTDQHYTKDCPIIAEKNYQKKLRNERNIKISTNTNTSNSQNPKNKFDTIGKKDNKQTPLPDADAIKKIKLTQVKKNNLAHNETKKNTIEPILNIKISTNTNTLNSQNPKNKFDTIGKKDNKQTPLPDADAIKKIKLTQVKKNNLAHNETKKNTIEPILSPNMYDILREELTEHISTEKDMNTNEKINTKTDILKKILDSDLELDSDLDSENEDKNILDQKIKNTGKNIISNPSDQTNTLLKKKNSNNQDQAIDLTTNIVNMHEKDQDEIMGSDNDTEPSTTKNNTDAEIKKITLKYNNEYGHKQ